MKKERMKELLQPEKLKLSLMLKDALERGGRDCFALYQRNDGSTEKITYEEIQQQGEAFLEKLKQAGMRKGDRIGVVSTLRPLWYSVLYAAVYGGYTLVTIDPGIPQKQTESMLRQTQVRAVVTIRGTEKLPPLLEDAIPIYAMERDFPLRAGPEKINGLLPEAETLPEECLFILFSSGTTGETRKAVMLSGSSITDAIEAATAEKTGVYRKESAYGVNERDLCVFPPYHIAGLLVAIYDLYCNTQMFLFERLTPAALMNAIGEFKPDIISAVPSLVTSFMKKIQTSVNEKLPLKLLVNALLGFCGFCRRVLDINPGQYLLKFLNRKAFGGNLKTFRIGGSPCDEATMRYFLNMGIDMNLAYGLTELGAPLVSTGRGYYPGSTGRVIRYQDKIDVRIVNPDEKGRGEVEVYSAFRMLRYMDEKQMEGCFTEDGYFRTGDLGYFDKNNCLVICGRSKEAIVMKNGEKLLPEEIEAQYQNISCVGTLSVFRVPDSGGCDSFAIAAVKESKALPDEVVRLHIADRVKELPAMYCPKEIYLLRELPLSSAKKVQRFRLTEMAIRGEHSPVSDAAMRQVEEDSTVGELRKILTKVGGPQWKAAELTEGLPLNLESLQAMELFVEIEENFGLDLMQLEKLPETFGELLEAVNNYEEQQKSEKQQLDLSQYPQPVKKAGRLFSAGVQKAVKLGYGVKGSGMENIPAEGNFLFCANHMTVLDPVWICACLTQEQRERTAVVGKADLIYDKLLKDLVRTQNLVPVDRAGNSMATLNRCRELLEEGWNVLIFPEGTNYENATELMPFKDGPARLAVGTGLSIIPIRIKGVVHKSSEDKSFLPKRGKDMQVIFGAPIDPGDMTVSQINAALRSAIEKL